MRVRERNVEAHGAAVLLAPGVVWFGVDAAPVVPTFERIWAWLTSFYPLLGFEDRSPYVADKQPVKGTTFLCFQLAGRATWLNSMRGNGIIVSVTT